MIPPAQSVAVDVLSEKVNFLVSLFGEGLRFANNTIGGPASLAPAREGNNAE
jgi:hypothetical protein